MIAGAERLAVDVADAQALKARAVSGDPEALRSAARQFESLMVAQMLKTMRSTSFAEEDDPMTGGDGVKLYRELLDQQWASKISNGRGLGFAEMMVKAMESRGNGVVSASALTNPASPFSGGMNAGAASASSPAAISPAGVSTVRAEPVEGQGFDRLSPNGSLDAAQRAGYTAPVSNRKQVFLENMKPHAEAAAAATGVPARFILAQAALESGWGEREIRSANGEASHNLFGIKAGRSWEGASVQTLTTEYRQGMPMKLAQNFRAYDDYSAGFTDYANVLKSRYGAALGVAGNVDGDAFANGLAAGGYATDPAYAGKLKSVIASVAMAGG
jgi:peptidoglycan hydrolase FlgJ